MIGSLPYGKFVGRTKVKHDVHGFSLSRMVPEVRAEEMPVHTHEDASFVFVIRGVYLSSTRNAGAACSGPALIFNPAGTKHRDRFQRLDGRFLAISVADGTLERVQQSVRLEQRAICFPNGAGTSAAQRIARECLAWNEGSPLLVEGLCLELLAAAAERQESAGKRPPAWLTIARELLSDRYQEAVRMDELAAEAGVHPVHLVRAFRQHFRCTPGEYVRRLRVERAARLLAGSTDSIAQIAALAGFADQSHFCKLFRKHWGVSPAEYRRSGARRKVASAPECLWRT